MANKYNIHLIKSRKSYSIKDMTLLLNKDRKTFSRWIKYEGLKVIGTEGNSPLVMGLDLKEFIQKQRASKKTPLAEDQYYCFKCHKAVRASVGSERVIRTGRKIKKTGQEQFKKIALCEICGTKINRYLGVYQKD